MKTIGVVANVTSREAVGIAEDLIDWLERRGLEVRLDSETSAALGSDGRYSPLEPESGCDLVVALGGDGTLLAIARTMTGIPVLGVNLGRLGFLTEIARTDLYPTLVKVFAGRYDVEERSLIDVEVRRSGGGKSIRFQALNDAVIAKSALAGIIELTLRVGGAFVASYRSDGIIISTPTGSTAYNLSAGGPILHPQLPVTVLTPICPHGFGLRPLVVPDTADVQLTLETRDEKVHLTLDGREATRLEPGDTVHAVRSEARTLLVKVSGRTFFDSLRGKLRWGELPATRT